MADDCCNGTTAECKCRENATPKRRDWSSDPRVLAEFCTCPTVKEWVLVDVDLDEMEDVEVYDANCPVHGLRAEPAPF